MTTRQGGGTPPPQREAPLLLREVLAECEDLLALTEQAHHHTESETRMGYNVNTTGINFTIPADKLEEACQALKDLNKNDELKSGGSSGPEGHKHWFSWMPEDYDETMDSAEEILNELGFDTESGFETEDGKPGDLSITGYDSKSGDQDVFLEALAPFVPDGSYVNWEGEDGTHWQCWFEGGVMTQKNGSIVYA